MSLNLSPVSSRTRSKSPREHRPRYLRDYCRSCLRLLAAKACRYSSCTGLPEDPDKTRFWYLSSDIYCSCSCTCNSLSDSDSDYESDNESDADYSPLEDEQDDQIHEQLIGPAEAAEETLARKYGWQVCATSEPLQGSIISDQIDRDYHFESPGHAAVAAMHDIGIPAESSLANSDNIITQSEAKSLERKLDPWELDVIHANTRVSHRDLARLFGLRLSSTILPSEPISTIRRLESGPPVAHAILWTLSSNANRRIHTVGCHEEQRCRLRVLRHSPKTSHWDRRP